MTHYFSDFHRLVCVSNSEGSVTLGALDQACPQVAPVQWLVEVKQQDHMAHFVMDEGSMKILRDYLIDQLKHE